MVTSGDARVREIDFFLINQHSKRKTDELNRSSVNNFIVVALVMLRSVALQYS